MIFEAEIVELIRASENRREPPCPHHGFSSMYCGGCAWQFVEYRAQLEAKQERVQFETDGEVLGFQAAKRGVRFSPTLEKL